jgi:hypothetical protein
MPSTKPTRKPYRPSGSGHILLPKQHQEMILPMHLALDAIERGRGNISNRHTLAAGINIAGSVAVNVHGGDDIIPMIDAAKAAIISMDHRYTSKKRWGMTGPEIKAVRAGVLVYSQLLRRSNTGTLEAAIAHVYRVNARTEHTLGSVQHPVHMEAA